MDKLLRHMPKALSNAIKKSYPKWATNTNSNLDYLRKREYPELIFDGNLHQVKIPYSYIPKKREGTSFIIRFFEVKKAKRLRQINEVGVDKNDLE